MIELKNIILGLSTKVYSLILSLLINILLARYLSIDNFGTYNYILAIIGIFNPLLDLGISQILIKEINMEKDINTPISIGIFVRFLGSLLSTILFIIIFKLGYYDINSFYIFTILIIFSLKITDIFQYIFEAQQKFKLTFIIPVIANMFFFILSFVLVLLKASLNSFLILKIFEEIVKSIFYLFYFKKINNKFRFSFNQSKFYYMLKQSLPLLLSGIAMVLYLRVDQIMIGKILGNKEVAFYSIGIRFAEIWYFVPSIISSIYYPRLIKLFTNDKNEYTNIKTIIFY